MAINAHANANRNLRFTVRVADFLHPVEEDGTAPLWLRGRKSFPCITLDRSSVQLRCAGPALRNLNAPIKDCEIHPILRHQGSVLLVVFRVIGFNLEPHGFPALRLFPLHLLAQLREFGLVDRGGDLAVMSRDQLIELVG